MMPGPAISSKLVKLYNEVHKFNNWTISWSQKPAIKDKSQCSHHGDTHFKPFIFGLLMFLSVCMEMTGHWGVHVHSKRVCDTLVLCSVSTTFASENDHFGVACGWFSSDIWQKSLCFLQCVAHRWQSVSPFKEQDVCSAPINIFYLIIFSYKMMCKKALSYFFWQVLIIFSKRGHFLEAVYFICFIVSGNRIIQISRDGTLFQLFLFYVRVRYVPTCFQLNPLVLVFKTGLIGHDV